MPTSGSIETVKDDIGTDDKAIVDRWKEELRLSGKNDEPWLKRGSKVVKRYRDERNVADKSDTRFNILWSNTETLKPALYARTPKTLVNRRNKERKDGDANKVAREVATVLQRCIEYAIDDYDFDGLMTQLVEDYQLPGRAVAWVNYHPTFKKERLAAEPEGYEDVDPVLDEFSGDLIDQPQRALYDEGVEYDDDDGSPYTMEDVVDWESTSCSYVYWKDFRTGRGDTWDEKPWVAKRSKMSRDDLHERFDDVMGADKVDKIPLNKTSTEINTENMDQKTLELFKRADIWEIWDKEGGQVIWICTDYNEAPLEVSEPPLSFRHFFPCNPPLTMIETNGQHEPIPEYVMYQDQAQEMDTLTMRINLLLGAVRVAGVYESGNAAVEGLLSKNAENKLIPISNWAMFADKGGLKGAISWLPIDMVISTMEALYKAREMIKQEMYEITGISDIIRGASDPREGVGTQKLKGQFASMRMQDKQKKVARCARSLVRLMGEVIAENFDKSTIELMSGMPVSDEVMELLQNDMMRRFTISIENDSTIQPNEREEQQSRNEFLKYATGFMKQAVGIAKEVPEFMTVMSQMLLFGVRGYRVGRDLEETIEDALDQMQDRMKADAQKPPPPDPKMIEVAGKQKEKAAVLQLKNQEHQQKMGHKEQDHRQDMVHDQESHDQKMQIDAEEHENHEDQT